MHSCIIIMVSRANLCTDERVINLQRTKVYVFSDSVLCLGRIHENAQSNGAWEDRLGWFKSSPEYRNFDRIDGEPMEFEWNIFPGFTTLQLVREVQELLSRLSVQPEKFHRTDYLHVDVQRHLLWIKRQQDRMRNKCSTVRGDLEQDDGHASDLVQRNSGRATSPVSRGQLKSKDHGKLSIHYCADPGTIENVFRAISSVFTEQSQKCVKNTKPCTIERVNPLWEDNRIPHSCQA